jgi:hypothetical protein
MFREAHTEAATGFWQAPDLPAAAHGSAAAAAFVEDEVGAVAHVYREIASRLRRNAFTRHASTLGKAQR